MLLECIALLLTLMVCLNSNTFGNYYNSFVYKNCTHHSHFSILYYFRSSIFFPIIPFLGCLSPPKLCIFNFWTWIYNNNINKGVITFSLSLNNTIHYTKDEHGSLYYFNNTCRLYYFKKSYQSKRGKIFEDGRNTSWKTLINTIGEKMLETIQKEI